MNWKRLLVGTFWFYLGLVLAMVGVGAVGGFYVTVYKVPFTQTILVWMLTISMLVANIVSLVAFGLYRRANHETLKLGSFQNFFRASLLPVLPGIFFLAYFRPTLTVALMSLALAVSTGISEEVFWRGFVLSELKPLGKLKAIVLSSAAFWFMHFFWIMSAIPRFGSFPALILGVICALMVYDREDVSYAAGFHAGWDFSAFILLAGLTEARIDVGTQLGAIYPLSAIAIMIAMYHGVKWAVLRRDVKGYFPLPNLEAEAR